GAIRTSIRHRRMTEVGPKTDMSRGGFAAMPARPYAQNNRSQFASRSPCSKTRTAVTRCGACIALENGQLNPGHCREDKMNLRQVLFSTAAAIGIAAMAVVVPAPTGAQQAAVEIDNDDIGGMVTGANGPEAGVWVIAETTELPTKYAKIVVTDDQGRYVIPDLPNANYQVWVRGYGLVDSPKVRAKPGQQLNLTAVPAPNERAAAHYYPAIYWYAM